MSPVKSGRDPRREAVEAIEDARRRVGLRAGAAARRAGITPSWWSAVTKGTKTRAGHVEQANPSVDTLIDMARVVGNEAEVRKILGLPVGTPSVASSPPDDGHERRSRPGQVTLDRLEWERQLAEAFQAGLRAGRASSEPPPQSEAG